MILAIFRSCFSYCILKYICLFVGTCMYRKYKVHTCMHFLACKQVPACMYSFLSVFHKYSNEKQKCTMGRYQHNIRSLAAKFNMVRFHDLQQVFRRIKISYFFLCISYALGVRKLRNAHHWAGYPKKAKKINETPHG
jgi:hypothetical protein